MWDDKKYKDFIDYLFCIKDDKYALFHQNLTKGKPVIGIKTNELKLISKKIINDDYNSFIKINKHNYYEEIVIHGLLIGYIKDYDTAICLFDEYINYIESWASCDIVVANFKIVKKNLDKVFIKIKEYLKNNNPWINRVGIVLLLTYYINDKYIDKVLKISKNIKSDNYYVKMANAWLLSICLVKYYSKTIEILKTNKLDMFTHNKTISKALESYRCQNKEELRKLKKTP